MIPPTIEEAVRFDSVSVRFPDGTSALDGLNLRIGRGEFVSIVGPSGCGKSTLLRVAAGLQEPTAGSVAIDRSSMGYVFQDPVLLPWRSVHGNTRLPAELHRADVGERDVRTDAALRLVGLADFAGHLPGQLSGGMRMRVSLARALVMDPQVLLFDEPFGALDEMTRERLNDEIRDLYTRQGFTGLFVTHSIAEAVYMSSRVIIMSSRPGRIIDDMTVDLPEQRSHDIRYTEDFGLISARVSAALRAGAE